MIKTLLLLSIALCYALHAQIVYSPTQKVIVDYNTSLVWQDTIENEKTVFTWDEAHRYCSNLKLGGFEDWEVPLLNQLKDLYSKKNSLPHYENAPYWSSDEYTSYNSYAWSFHFGHGTQKGESKTDSYYIRCVREIKNPQTMTKANFLNSISTFESNASTLLIKSSSIDPKNEFIVQDGESVVLGNPHNILFHMHMSPVFIDNPSVKIAQDAIKELNQYLATPAIPKPFLQKNEFETNEAFALRVQNAQNEYRNLVTQRNIVAIDKNILAQKKYHDLLLIQLGKVFGAPKLSNPLFDAQTNTLYFDIAATLTNWNARIKITVNSIETAKLFKADPSKLSTTITFKIHDNLFVVESISIEDINASILEAQKSTIAIPSMKPTYADLQNPNLIIKTPPKVTACDDLKPLIKKAKQKAISGKKWLFSIGIEKYKEADDVLFAQNSTLNFVNSAIKKFGISKTKTVTLLNTQASTTNITNELQKMVSKIKKGDEIIFYFNGHGIKDLGTEEPYLLAYEAIADFVAQHNSIALQTIINKLAQTKAKKITIILDTSFDNLTNGIQVFKGIETVNTPANISIADKRFTLIMPDKDTVNIDKANRTYTYDLIKSYFKGK